MSDLKAVVDLYGGNNFRASSKLPERAPEGCRAPLTAFAELAMTFNSGDGRAEVGA